MLLAVKWKKNYIRDRKIRPFLFSELHSYFIFKFNQIKNVYFLLLELKENKIWYYNLWIFSNLCTYRFSIIRSHICINMRIVCLSTGFYKLFVRLLVLLLIFIDYSELVFGIDSFEVKLISSGKFSKYRYDRWLREHSKKINENFCLENKKDSVGFSTDFFKYKKALSLKVESWPELPNERYNLTHDQHRSAQNHLTKKNT